MEPWDPLDHPARIEVRRQESDDSDAEGGLGNVTRVVLRPPGHSGKAKRGHLCFDASFEGGNLGRVDFISEYEYDLFIRPDTCNPRYRLWFNFVVDNVRADQRVIFNLVNLCKTNTLFRDGMTPLVKTSTRPKWQRLPEKYVYYHKSPEHRNHYILSFAFAFDREEDVYQFALSFPYSYSRLQSHIDLLVAKDWPYLKRDTIAFSLQSRKLDVLTITSAGVIVGSKKPKVVVVMGRSHPGESSSSFVAQGLLDFMVSSHPIAIFLRDHLVIKIIPMINPDGVFMGNYRSSLMGYDLNRHWNQVSPWAHPTLHALKNYLVDLDANKTLDLDMVIDLHVHTSLMGAFIYGNSYDDVYRFERHILFPKLLAHNAEDYAVSHTMYNRDPNKVGTARRHLCEILRNTVNVYTFQVSILGYHQPLTGATVLYNEEGYFRLGRNIARTFFEYYKATGIIPPSALIPSTPSQTESEKKTVGTRRSRSRSRPPRISTTTGKNGHKGHPSQQQPSCLNENQDPMTSSSATNKTIVQLSQLTREKNSDDDDGESEDSSFSSTSPTSDQDQDQNPKRTRCHKTRRLPRKIRNNLLQNQGILSRSRSKTPSPSPAPGGGKQMPKIVSRRQPAYKTFDFSILKDFDYLATARRIKQGTPGAPTSFISRRGGGGRKIGGGGIVSKSGTNIKNRLTKSYTVPAPGDTAIPSLTIIDFNLLIRAGLENRLQLGRERRRVLGAASPGMFRNGASRFRRRNHQVRRRLALVLRGNVTDCSPWEDSGSCSEPESRNHSAPPPLNRKNSSESPKLE